MKIFNYIFVSDVLSRLILFLVCIFCFLLETGNKTKIMTRLRTQKQMGLQLGPGNAMEAWIVLSQSLVPGRRWNTNSFRDIIFIIVWVLEGRCHVVVMTQTWDKIWQTGPRWCNTDDRPVCSSCRKTLSNIKTSWTELVTTIIFVTDKFLMTPNADDAEQAMSNSSLKSSSS